MVDVIAERSPFDYARALKPGGRYYAAGGLVATMLKILVAGPIIRLTRNRTLRVLVVRRNRKDLAEAIDLCNTGKLKVHIDRVYPLDDAREALRHLGEGRAKGKFVISVSKG